MAGDEDEARKGNGQDEGDDEQQLPDDPAELKRLLGESRRRLGRLTNEAKQAKKARADLTEQITRWSRLGDDPEAIERRLAERDEQDLRRARDSGGEEAQQMIENLRQKQAKVIEEKDREIQRHRELLAAVMIDDRLMAVLAKYVDTSKPGLIEGAFKILREKVRTVPDAEAPRGYSPVVEVADDQVPLEDYVAQWADTDPKAQAYLKQSQATGGGAHNAGGRPRKQLYRSQMTAKEKSEYINANGGGGAGMAAYMALPVKPAEKAA